MPSPAHADPNTVIADLMLQQKVLEKQVEDVRSDVRELARAVSYLTEVAAAKPVAVAKSVAPSAPAKPPGPTGFQQLKKMTEGSARPEVSWDGIELRE
jgi:hypothetical protein